MRKTLKLILVGLTLAIAGGAFAQRPWVAVAMTDVETFQPQTLFVPAGTIVVWPNTSGDWHAIQSDVPGFGPDSDLVFPTGYPRGYYYWWRVPDFAQPGTVFYYHCRFHGAPSNGVMFGSGMVGRIVVQ